MKVKIKFLDENAQIPTKSHDNDACYDVTATSKEDLGDGRIIYGLGFSLELPEGTQMDIRPRSSISKTGLILSNSIGTADEGYRGEYGMLFYHVLPHLPAYEVGDRVGQIQLCVRNDVDFVPSEKLEESTRGEGGWGSTGK